MKQNIVIILLCIIVFLLYGILTHLDAIHITMGTESLRRQQELVAGVIEEMKP